MNKVTIWFFSFFLWNKGCAISTLVSTTCKPMRLLAKQMIKSWGHNSHSVKSLFNVRLLISYFQNQNTVANLFTEKPPYPINIWRGHLYAWFKKIVPWWFWIKSDVRFSWSLKITLLWTIWVSRIHIYYLTDHPGLLGSTHLRLQYFLNGTVHNSRGMLNPCFVPYYMEFEYSLHHLMYTFCLVMSSLVLHISLIALLCSCLCFNIVLILALVGIL